MYKQSRSETRKMFLQSQRQVYLRLVLSSHKYLSIFIGYLVRPIKSIHTYIIPRVAEQARWRSPGRFRRSLVISPLEQFRFAPLSRLEIASPAKVLQTEVIPIHMAH